MEEQNEGSRQIGDALKAMNNSTLEVQKASKAMSSKNTEVLGEMQHLQDSTQNMQASMHEMSDGAQKINETGESLSGICGDVQIAKQDLLCVGTGIRTNTLGVDYLAKQFADKGKFNIIAQQLPMHPESFIHLDMVFTFLDKDKCMMYEPMLRKSHEFAGLQTTLVSVDNGKISYRDCGNILEALRLVGMDLEPVFCGGHDLWNQQREHLFSSF